MCLGLILASWMYFSPGAKARAIFGFYRLISCLIIRMGWLLARAVPSEARCRVVEDW